VILYHLPPDGYEFGNSLPTDPNAAAERWARVDAVMRPRAITGVALLLNGADHHARQLDQREAVSALAGAARPNGVKDLDVWTFYAARAGAQFPAAKRETHADFGPSSLGYQSYTQAEVTALGARVHRWERYSGRRVDFLMRALPVPPGCPPDEAEDAIVNWLTVGAQSTSPKPPSSWHLSRKAVVGMWPPPLAGRTLWPSSPDARNHIG